jgi:hypothetical protein
MAVCRWDRPREWRGGVSSAAIMRGIGVNNRKNKTAKKRYMLFIAVDELVQSVCWSMIVVNRRLEIITLSFIANKNYGTPNNTNSLSLNTKIHRKTFSFQYTLNSTKIGFINFKFECFKQNTVIGKISTNSKEEVSGHWYIESWHSHRLTNIGRYVWFIDIWGGQKRYRAFQFFVVIDV